MTDSSDTQPPNAPLARQLGTQTLYVMAGNLFTLAVGFPLQVYVAHVLGAEGVGTYGLIEAGVMTVAGLLGFGLAPTVMRFVPAYLERLEYAKLRALVRLGAGILLAIGIAAYVALISSLGWSSRVWSAVAGHRDAIALMGLMIPLSLILYFLQLALRGFREIRYMVFGSSFLQLAVKVGVTVVAFGLGLRLQGYVLATVVATFSSILWMSYGLRRQMGTLPFTNPNIDRSETNAWWRYAAISYGGSVLSAATGNSDQFLLGSFFGAASVGVWVVVRQLQQMPLAFNQMLLMVGAPMFSTLHSRNAAQERQHLYVLMTDWLVRMSLPLVLFLLLFADRLLALYGKGFSEDGTRVLQLLALTQFFNLACGPTGNVAMMSGLEAVTFRYSFLSIVFSTSVVVLLVPFTGLIGAGVATAAGVVSLNLAMLVELRRKLNMRWWDRRYLGWIAPAIAVFVLGMLLHGVGGLAAGWQLLIALSSMYATFAAVSLAFGLHEDDKDFLRHIRDRALGAIGST
jgi:O-antigen/teichoic acid export membrane protein